MANMGENGVLEWQFTRTYDIGEGPWPSTDEATIEYDREQSRVIIRGVYYDGNTAREGCVRRVLYHRKEDTLSVDIGSVEKRMNGSLALDTIQRIHYEVTVIFRERLPNQTTVEHLSQVDDVQFSTTEYVGQ